MGVCTVIRLELFLDYTELLVIVGGGKSEEFHAGGGEYPWGPVSDVHAGVRRKSACRI